MWLEGGLTPVLEEWPTKKIKAECSGVRNKQVKIIIINKIIVNKQNPLGGGK